MQDELIVDLPEVVAEVRAAFERYENALVGNDVAALDSMFRDDPRTIRYGGGENLYGFAAIAAFRAGRSPQGLARDLSRTVITTYGRNFATASTLFRRASAPGEGWKANAMLGEIRWRMESRRRPCQRHRCAA